MFNKLFNKKTEWKVTLFYEDGSNRVINIKAINRERAMQDVCMANRKYRINVIVEPA